MDRPESWTRSFARLAAGTAVVSALLCGCTTEPAPHPFQRLAVFATADALQPYVGSWCNRRGEVLLTIASRPSPAVQVRLPELLRLTDARIASTGLVLAVEGDQGLREVVVQLLEPDLSALVPPGQTPSFCETCTPYLTRGLWSCVVQRARARVDKLPTIDVSRAIEDFLVDHF